MAITNTTESELTTALQSLLSPSNPIRSPEFLVGRDKSLTEIRRQLAVNGRHVFIFGDRGVGKTSLAQTAAIDFQGSDSDPIIVAGGHGESFSSIIGTIAKRVFASSKKTSGKTAINLKLTVPFVSAGIQHEIENGNAPSIATLNDAIDALRWVSHQYQGIPIIVIDEFDRIEDVQEKIKFAELIKQMSDQEVNLKIIFCGIGQSMEELIGLHYSTGRAITPIELQRLDHGSLVKIINSAVEGVGLKIDHETVTRVAILSDGYPYFAHLVAEKMIWSAFDTETMIDTISGENFGMGVNSAVSHSTAFLKEPYELATKKYNDSYEEVLWALVDRPVLMRQSSAIYNESYLRIAEERNRIPMEIKSFYNRLNALKSSAHGAILKSPRSGWFEFRENMIRGYVKLKAAENRVEIGVDHYNSAVSRSPQTSIESNYYSR